MSLSFLLIRYFKPFVFLLAATILVGGYFGILRPKYHQLKEKDLLNLKAQQLDLVAQKEKLQNLKRLKQSSDELRKQKIQDLRKALPSQAGIPALLVELEDLVLKSGFKIQSIDIQEEVQEISEEGEEEGFREEGEGFPEAKATQEGNLPIPTTSLNIKKLDITLGVSGAGDYQSFKKLLKTLENNLRLMDLISFTYAPKGKEEEKAGGGYALNLRTYYLE